MSGTIKAFLLLAAIAAAALRSCQEQRLQGSKRLHRPGKIDSVAIQADDHDSLKVWDVIDSVRDEKMRRMRTGAILEFLEYDSMALHTRPDYVRMADSLGVQRIAKADFDGNGFTDLLLPGSGWPIVILDDGNSKYRTVPLTLRGTYDRIYPVLRRTSVQPEILAYYFPLSRTGDYLVYSLKVDTLVYYKGEFIEENAHSMNYRIEHIHLSQGCSQLCAPFDLFIDSIGKAIYITDHAYWKDTLYAYGKDTLTATIDKRSLEDIYSMLCYIDFPRLQDYYAIEGTDQQAYATTIIYDGGKTKTIGDYGQVGTHGLALLYYQLLELRSNQRWTKIGESNHR